MNERLRFHSRRQPAPTQYFRHRTALPSGAAPLSCLVTAERIELTADIGRLVVSTSAKEHAMQKSETIVAAFDTTKAAEADVQDLQAARIPSAVVRRGSGTLRGRARAAVQPPVMVAADYKHADLAAGILSQYATVGVVDAVELSPTGRTLWAH
jgi:hypothetical protein